MHHVLLVVSINMQAQIKTAFHFDSLLPKPLPYLSLLEGPPGHLILGNSVISMKVTFLKVVTEPTSANVEARIMISSFV